MKLRRTCQLIRVFPLFLIALVCAGSSMDPLAHVDVTVVHSYEGKQPLSKPIRVVIYDFTVAKSVIQTDRLPGIRQRVDDMRSSGDPATVAAEQVKDQITKSLTDGLKKRLKATSISIEKGTPEMEISPATLVVRGEVTKLSQGHRLRRGTVGLGAGASDVETDCQISVQLDGNAVVLSELTTKAKSGKKPGAAVTAGVGAAPEVAAGVTGATAHKSTAQGDAGRTGSALASHIAKAMVAQGWIPSADEPQPATTEQSQ